MGLSQLSQKDKYLLSPHLLGKGALFILRELCVLRCEVHGQTKSMDLHLLATNKRPSVE